MAQFGSVRGMRMLRDSGSGKPEAAIGILRTGVLISQGDMSIAIAYVSPEVRTGMTCHARLIVNLSVNLVEFVQHLILY